MEKLNVEIAGVIERVLKAPSALDLSSFCLIPKRTVWIFYVDILVCFDEFCFSKPQFIILIIRCLIMVEISLMQYQLQLERHYQQLRMFQSN